MLPNDEEERYKILNTPICKLIEVFNIIYNIVYQWLIIN